MATATIAPALPPLMRAREAEKDYEFPCTSKHHGMKCERRFHRLQALGRHKSTVHSIPGKTAAKKKATKVAALKRSAAPKRTIRKTVSAGEAKTKQVVEMTAANHPQIGTTMRVTGLIEGGHGKILMLLTQGELEWKAVLE